MPADARQHILRELYVYLTASIAQSLLPVFNSSHSLPWAKPHCAALFRQAEKQPCARGLLQGPLLWPRLSKTLQAQAPNKAPHSNYLHIASVLNQPEKKSMAIRLQGRSGKPALHKTTPGYIKLSTKTKFKFLNRFPSLSLFQLLSLQLLCQSEKWSSLSFPLQSTHLIHQSSAVQTYILSQCPCLLFILRYWPWNIFSNKISVSSHWNTP